MKKYLLTTLAVHLIFVLQAQKGAVKGIVKDTAASHWVKDATITVLKADDSSLVSFSRTNDSGFFIIRNIDYGRYRLLITHVGYHTITRAFVLNAAMRDLDFGIITIVNNSILLQEITVIQDKPPVVIRNDTIEFNAGSFKTRPNAVVEDLLKKLPGLQVDKDGKIRSNGTEVKKVLVDGKEFFGNDPSLATKNLPADAVDKVQVFDRKSDQSRFTGFDDGNSEKTINLTIKPDRKNGVFGKATAGAGNKKLYEGNFTVNSFSGERQLSAIGMLNNTNKQGFSFLDLLNFSGALPGGGGRSGGMQLDLNSTGLPVQGSSNNNEGITNTGAGGLNYNNAWQKKTELMSSYFYNRQQTALQERLQQQWLLPGNRFTTAKDNTSNTINAQHRATLTADYKIDSANAIRFTTAFSLQQLQYNGNSIYKSVSDSGGLLNQGYAQSRLQGNGYSWSNTALFRHRFAKKGRTFSASLSVNINNTRSDGQLLSENNYYLPGGGLQHSDTINQVNHQDGRNGVYSVVASYTEPLSKKSLLEFNYAFSTAHRVTEKTTYDYDRLSGKHSVQNNLLSNSLLNNYHYHRPGINWRYQQTKYSFAIGTSVQQASLASKFHLLAGDTAVDRAFLQILPNANFQYNISPYQNLRFLYNTDARPPSVTQLQPLADNTDPLNIKIGNPGLKQEYNYRFLGDYISFDPYRHTSFFATVRAGMSSNRIVNADQVGQQGQRLTQPVNVNGTYNLLVNTAWGFPVTRLKGKLNLNTSIEQNHNINFINTQRNTINAFTATQEVTWNYSYKELLDVGAGAAVTFNNVKYSLQQQQNIQYWNQHFNFDVNVYLPGGFSIASDVDYTTRSGLAQGYDVSVFLWNAGIARQLFSNKKGELRLQVYDILNQRAGISRSSNQNYIEDKSYNVLRRYFQLSFTYVISRFAGKNMAAPSRKNNAIQVIQGRG